MVLKTRSPENECEDCEGSGVVITAMTAGFNSRTMEIYAKEVESECGACEGTGEIQNEEEE
jgi:DnaJ-class molecular chaperone